MSQTVTEIAPTVLAELRAALTAGASPAEALAIAAGDGVLAPVGRAARLGQPLDQLAAQIDSGVPAADLLVRALGLAERTGGGALAAVEQALLTVREETELERAVKIATAQARGTATVLAVLPAALWVLLVALDRSLLRFYATPIGSVTGAAAIAMALVSWWCARLLARRVIRSGAACDPLWTAGRGGTGRGGAAETADLLGVALASGLAPAQALAAVGPLAPPAAREVLAAAQRRLAAGWTADQAFAGSPLEPLGQAIAVAARWGAPAGPALAVQAAEWRAKRRAATAVAARRLELLLVFPTTLFTLPSFVLGVMPPLLWSALAG